MWYLPRRQISSSSSSLGVVVTRGAVSTATSSSVSPQISTQQRSTSSCLSNNNTNNVNINNIGSIRKNNLCSSLPFSSPQLVNSQRNQVDASMEKKFHCSVCKKSFRFEMTAKTHIQSVHAGQGSVETGAAPSSSSATATPTTAGTGGSFPTMRATSPTSSSATGTQQQATQAQGQATRFVTLNPGATTASVGGDAFGGDESYFKRQIYRQRALPQPLNAPALDIPDKALNEMLGVWDKWGEKRQTEFGNGELFKKSSDFVLGSVQDRKQDEESIPTYQNVHDVPTDSANPFASVVSNLGLEETQQEQVQVQQEPKQEEEVQAKQQVQEEKVETPTSEEATSETKTQTSTSTSSNIAFSDAVSNENPFIRAPVTNPFVTNPKPAALPKVSASALAAAAAAAANNAAASSADASSSSSAFEGDDGASMAMMMGDNEAYDDGKSGTSASAFAAAMQSTSPFSITESSAPLESAAATIISSTTTTTTSDSAVASPFGAAVAASASAVSSPFAAAAAASSPFGNAPTSQQQQQQQATPAVASSPFSASPFAASTTTTTTTSQQQQQSTPFVVQSTGAPLTPIEAAVDLSALFGSPSAQLNQQQAAEVFTCKVCGKNTFKTEAAMISHCHFKHGVTVTSETQAGRNKKAQRTLPDLPPYIPTPVDLGATAPYGGTRQKASTTSFWNEVELAPHARVFSSMTLLGEVTSLEKGFVLDVPVVQMSIYVAATESTPEEEEIVVRCFGKDLEHLSSSLSVGCTVLVEGTLRLNPSYENASNKYYANPAVHVASPNGFVQRLD